MSDATFFLLDALLNAAKGMLMTARTKTVMKENNIQEDPRSGTVKFFTNPLTLIGTSLASSYLFNKGIESSAKNIAEENSNSRRF